MDGNPAVSINITGDVLLGRDVKPLIDKSGLKSVMGGVAPVFSSADYTLINLECPATKIIAPRKKPHVFRADPALLSRLSAVGVTHAGVANNHAFDQDKAGFVDTLKNLATARIIPVGAAYKKEELTPSIMEKNGVKIAVFAVNMVEVNAPVKKISELRPCEASSEDVLAEVKSYHQRYPEIHAIVFLHWGEEYSLFPTDNQTSLAHSLIDAGADAVIGCHPHVVQGVEVYHGRPIAYSLGNLLFDQSLPETQHDLIITLSFEKDSLIDATLNPVRQVNGTPQLERALKLDLKKDKMKFPSELVQ